VVWALISGLRGDLEAYEALLKNLRRHRGVDTLFVLGDLIGPGRDCNPLLDRLQYPRRGELTPECIYGWWEEQLLAERGFRGERRADALREGAMGRRLLMLCDQRRGSKPSPLAGDTKIRLH